MDSRRLMKTVCFLASLILESVGDLLASMRDGGVLAHQMEFATIEQLPGDLVPGIESDSSGQRQGKVNVESCLLLSASDGLHFERIFRGRGFFCLVFHELGYSLAFMALQIFSSSPAPHPNH